MHFSQYYSLCLAALNKNNSVPVGNEVLSFIQAVKDIATIPSSVGIVSHGKTIIESVKLCSSTYIGTAGVTRTASHCLVPEGCRSSCKSTVYHAVY